MSEIQKLDYIALKPKILIILGLLVDSTTLPSQPLLALHINLQPRLVSLPSVLNLSLTTLVLLRMLAGMEVPQLFSIKTVPSPSSIIR